MDPEIRSWTQRQDAATQEIAADQKRQADALTIMAKELAAITNLLTPRVSEGESPLEHLLAQLVAQGNVQLQLLRGLAQQKRIERGSADPAEPASTRANGNGRGMSS